MLYYVINQSINQSINQALISGSEAHKTDTAHTKKIRAHTHTHELQTTANYKLLTH